MTTSMRSLFQFERKKVAPRKVAEAKATVEAPVPVEAEAKLAAPRAAAAKPQIERRHRRRVRISAPIRVRPVHLTESAEADVTMTVDVSREGVLIESARESYARSQEVAVAFPYRPQPGEQVTEQRGTVVRVVKVSERRRGVAIAFLPQRPAFTQKDDLVNSAGNPFPGECQPEKSRAVRSQRPLVIVVDDDARARIALRTQLEMEGYAVEGVANPAEAVAILRHRIPAALVCEAEPFVGALPDGSEMSGYDLCVIVRRHPKMKRMPVILTTRTGMPSDFATAHALGATVCVSKPYDLERVANVVRMLVPVEE